MASVLVGTIEYCRYICTAPIEAYTKDPEYKYMHSEVIFKLILVINVMFFVACIVIQLYNFNQKYGLFILMY